MRTSPIPRTIASGNGMWSKAPTTWAAGAEIGYKTIGGPLKIGSHWCGMTGFGITGSYGFYF